MGEVINIEVTISVYFHQSLIKIFLTLSASRASQRYDRVSWIRAFHMHFAACPLAESVLRLASNLWKSL